ncbi:MAG: hypothetical protein KDB27_32615, partial [Planctomycetales bacterium]|nr:hypothetical protein [Planctomycetales bacterium]
MLSSLLNSGKKLRNRGVLGKKRRPKNRNYQLEALEDRQLLTAVTHEAAASDWEFSVGSRADADRPWFEITAPDGQDQVLVISASWTDTADLDITVADTNTDTDVDGNGSQGDVTPISRTLDDGVGPLEPGHLVPYVSETNTYAGTVFTTAMWVIPIDGVSNVGGTGVYNPADPLQNAYNAMERRFKVHVTDAGTSTDVYVRGDIYKNVDQVNGPVGPGRIKLQDVDGGGPGAPTVTGNAFADGSDSILMLTNVGDPDHMMVDMFTGLESVGVPMGLTVDTPGGQVENNPGAQEHGWGNPPQNGAIYLFDSASSHELEGADPLSNMKWEGNGLVNSTDRYRATTHIGFTLIACDAAITSGGGAIVSSPCYDTLYDFGDAPASYGAARHAPKGPYIGALRDSEAANQPSNDARGDDNNNQDDEDGVTQTAGQPLDLGVNPRDFTFVTKKHGNN